MEGSSSRRRIRLFLLNSALRRRLVLEGGRVVAEGRRFVAGVVIY
jgi:hypothetical protein